MNIIYRLFIGCLIGMVSVSALADQDRVRREMVETLEAYAVYKMGLYEEAFDAWLLLAEKGNSQGILNVANMYQAGEGVEKDLGKAFYWYQQGANQGDPRSLFNLARVYEQGLGVDHDVDKATLYYQRAAGAGSIEAQRIVGLSALEQDDQSQAEYWLKRAASHGDHIAVAKLKELGIVETVLHDELTAEEQIQIQGFLDDLDGAANARDATALTRVIRDDATIRVRLPGQATFQAMDKSAYRDLWQVTFNKPVRYRFNRTQYDIRKQAAGYQIHSTIREYLTSESKTRQLILQENLRIQFDEEMPVITQVELRVEAAGS